MDLSLEHKFKTLVADGLTVSEIANQLGMNEQVVRRKLLEMGLTTARSSRRLPYGISNDTHALRSALGFILTDMLQDMELRTVCEETGLNQREIGNAKQHPFRHDWKLSQVERTLRCGGKTLKEIV